MRDALRSMQMSRSLIGMISESMEISKEIMAAEGELSPELDARLTVLESELPSKVDNYTCILEQLNHGLETWKSKKELLDKMIKGYKYAIDRLEGNIIYGIKALGLEKISGNESAFKLRKNPGMVIIEDENKISSEYKVQTVVTTIDKKKILSDLRNGIPVQGARLEITESLMETKPDLL